MVWADWLHGCSTQCCHGKSWVSWTFPNSCDLQTCSDSYNKSGCGRAAVAVTLLTLKHLSFDIAAESIKHYAQCGNSAKASCGMQAASWCNGRQFLPLQTEGFRVWAYYASVSHWTLRRTWVTLEAVWPLHVLSSSACVPCCAAVTKPLVQHWAILCWGFWSVQKKEEKSNLLKCVMRVKTYISSISVKRQVSSFDPGEAKNSQKEEIHLETHWTMKETLSVWKPKFRTLYSRFFSLKWEDLSVITAFHFCIYTR